MIQVENLTKRFGSTTAIQDVSFTVEKGEVVGFLGPNGAGKTTTMRVLAGSLGATGGRALVAGMDVFEQPREVKRRLGYLPETPPVYGNMTVREYVRFAARIKGVADVNAATERVIEQVGLLAMAPRLIDHLSKGFKQRVGLAQALVHSPDVLILDEPTSGLDPAQRVEIRELIRDLAKGESTVILSTHVLPEVENICQRVIIISQGRIVAQDRIEALAQEAHLVRIQVARPHAALVTELRAVQGVVEVQDLGNGAYSVRTTGDMRSAIARVAVRHDLVELTGRERLEEVYLRLTSGHSVMDPSATDPEPAVADQP